MSIIREVGLLAYEWLAARFILEPVRMLCAARFVIGKERAGRLVFRWIHLCHRLFSGGCAKATP